MIMPGVGVVFTQPRTQQYDDAANVSFVRGWRRRGEKRAVTEFLRVAGLTQISYLRRDVTSINETEDIELQFVLKKLDVYEFRILKAVDVVSAEMKVRRRRRRKTGDGGQQQGCN